MKALSASERSEIIEMAWCDRTSFDAIEATYGLSEKDVIEVMRANLKPSSFRLWRKRVGGRAAKHRHKDTDKRKLPPLAP